MEKLLASAVTSLPNNGMWYTSLALLRFRADWSRTENPASTREYTIGTVSIDERSLRMHDCLPEGGREKET